MENLDVFPERTNVHFVERLAPDRVRMRVWERGCGETFACGTGACAVGVAGVLTGRTGSSVDIELRGGILHITWQGSGHSVMMTGPAVQVYEGSVAV
jgi:diaminopimelate epimerase